MVAFGFDSAELAGISQASKAMESLVTAASARKKMDPSLQELIAEYRNGIPGALDRLVPFIYDDLRRLAHRHVNQWPNLTIDTTGVVHEAYLKLVRQHALNAADKAHLLAICSSAMRQFIVVYARQKLTEKRGANPNLIDIHALDIPVQGEAEELLLIDQALRSLAGVDERMVKVFECRFFAGLTEEETAEALGIPLRTAQRDWMRARAWIKELLSSE